MRDYMFPNTGNAGEFGSADTAGRKLDSAGKLIKQMARPDLKNTNQEDPKRQPAFKIR